MAGILHPSTGKNLYLAKECAPHVVPALQELVRERVTEVLPTLQGLFLEELDSGPVQKAIEKLVAARQLFNHPIVISNWNRLGGEVVGG